MSPRPPLRFHLGTFTTIGAILLAVGAITLAGLGSFGAFSGLTSMRMAMLAAPTPPELEASLARVGITAESLAAAGCSDADVASIGANTLAHLTITNWTALVVSDQAVADARDDADRLGKLVRAGQASQDDLDSYTAAKATLSVAETARDSLLDHLYDAATADLAAGEIAAIETIHANRSRPAPVQYRVAARTDAEWTTLRDAIANIKTSAMCEEEPNSESVHLVTQCDAETEVAAAAARLENNLGGVQSTLRTALGYE
ncbi:MAG: hypothetical protein Q9O74_12130 [Planctomycetota bacterium]|nr:hypothetical protein [Planctomycetota bacterium]